MKIALNKKNIQSKLLNAIVYSSILKLVIQPPSHLGLNLVEIEREWFFHCELRRKEDMGPLHIVPLRNSQQNLVCFQ